MTNNIGGIDTILEAPPGVHVVELILRRIRHFWPDAYYQNADDANEVYSIHDDWVSISSSLAHEFFIYKDAATAQSWDRDGAVPENHNTMIHFMVGAWSSTDDLQQITVVCDEETTELRKLFEDMGESFRNSIPDTLYA
jgi:hypothetical protein